MSSKTSRMATLIVVLFVCLLLMAAAIKMQKSVRRDALQHKSSPVALIEMKPQHFEDALTFTGTVRPTRETPLRFEIGGIIEFLDFKWGDKIKKGAVIARLNQRELYLKLKKARLENEHLEMECRFGATLPPDVEKAKKAIARAQAELEKTVLRCPWDGILIGTVAVVGQSVTPDTTIGTLVNIEKVLVSFNVPENEISRLSPGNKFVFTHETYPNVEFTGILNHVVPPEGTTILEAELRNDGALLLPGMIGSLKITIFERANSLYLPNEAIQRTSTGNRVFVVNNQNRAEAREVTIDYVSAQYSLLSQGLASGDRVISPFPENLKPGEAVTSPK